MAQLIQGVPGRILQNDKTASDYINWYGGKLEATAAQPSPDYGSRTKWDQDTTYPVSNLGNKDIHEDNAYSIESTSGKTHYANFVQNTGSTGLWIDAHLCRGFSIDFQSNSTSGHAIWLERVGIEFLSDGGMPFMWSSAGRSKPGDTNLQSATYMLAQNDIDNLSGMRFHRFWARASTAGGSLTTSSNLKLGKFRLLYQAASTRSVDYLVGEYRREGDRKDTFPKEI